MTESLTKLTVFFKKHLLGFEGGQRYFIHIDGRKILSNGRGCFWMWFPPIFLGGISFQIHISMIGSAVCSMSQSVQNCQQRIFKNTGMSSLRQLNTGCLKRCVYTYSAVACLIPKLGDLIIHKGDYIGWAWGGGRLNRHQLHRWE